MSFKKEKGKLTRVPRPAVALISRYQHVGGRTIGDEPAGLRRTYANQRGGSQMCVKLGGKPPRHTPNTRYPNHDGGYWVRSPQLVVGLKRALWTRCLEFFRKWVTECEFRSIPPPLQQALKLTIQTIPPPAFETTTRSRDASTVTVTDSPPVRTFMEQQHKPSQRHHENHQRYTTRIIEGDG